jgi:hypothetical protein
LKRCTTSAAVISLIGDITCWFNDDTGLRRGLRSGDAAGRAGFHSDHAAVWPGAVSGDEGVALPRVWRADRIGDPEIQLMDDAGALLDELAKPNITRRKAKWF